MLLPGDEAGLGYYRPLADINVTPLVDVMLVMLVVFMVTAPMLVAGLPVDLPKTSNAQPVDSKPTVVVTVTKEGRTLIGDNEIPPDQLTQTVLAQLSGARDRTVYVQGDRDAPYGLVVSVIDTLADGGIPRVMMIVDRTRSSAPEPRR